MISERSRKRRTMVGPVRMAFRGGATWALVEGKALTWGDVEAAAMDWTAFENMKK